MGIWQSTLSKHDLLDIKYGPFFLLGPNPIFYFFNPESLCTQTFEIFLLIILTGNAFFLKQHDIYA